eukprot:Gb_25281 [translate_table: standard]
MGDVQEDHGRGHQGRNIISDPEQGRSVSRRIFAGVKKIHWLLVISSILELIVGQAVASRNLAGITLTRKQSSKLTTLAPKLVFIYIALGLLVAGDCLLYSWGVSFMPVSTYSLLCSSQLAFTAVFALILTRQRISPYILNSLVLLAFSAILLVIHLDSDRPAGVSSRQYIIGFICTVAASAIYGLILPLTPLVFNKVTKRETFTVVLEMQIYTSIVATVVCIMGLFISGESRQLKEEARNFTTGKRAYCMTLIWSAIGWQVCSVGVIGLIFLVSSLFSNVMSTLSLPVVPILAVGFFHDKMNALKIMAMLLGIWGFVSYVFGGYVDSKSAMDSKNASREDQHISLAEG